MSMIGIRLASASDRETWDAFVQQFPSVPPYQVYAWKDIIETAYSVPCYFFLAENNEGKLCGTLPTYVTKTFSGKSRLYGLRYGLLGESPTVCQKILSHLQDFCREREIVSSLIPAGFKKLEDMETLSAKTTVLLSLQNTKEETWKSLRDKTRNMIRKGERAGLTVECGFHNLHDFYEIYALHMRHLGVYFHSIRFFENMEQYLKDRIELICAKKAGHIIAGTILLYGKSVASYPFQAHRIEYRNTAPVQLMNWDMMKRCLERQIPFLDMGESKIGSKVYQSKTNFGGEPKELYYYSVHPFSQDFGKGSPRSSVPHDLRHSFGLKFVASVNWLVQRTPLRFSTRLSSWMKSKGRII